MFHLKLSTLRKLIKPETQRSTESVAVFLAIAFFPMLIMLGTALDFSRAKNFELAVQAALDAAVLSGGRDGSADWIQTAQKSFRAQFSFKPEPPPKPTFFQEPSTGNYTGTVTAKQSTSVLGLINVSSIAVTAKATAVADKGVSLLVSSKNMATNPNAWTVSALSGKAYLTAPSRQSVLTEGEVLRSGDTVRTGAHSQVLLTRGQETILIDGNSTVGIPASATTDRSTTIHQWAGSILLAVEKQNTKSFQVVTPYLTAVVKGTRFRVTVNQDESNVEVLRGQVEVGDVRSGQYAVVNPGQTAKVETQRQAGLSLSGSGTLNPILRRPAHSSPVNPAGLIRLPTTGQVSQTDEPQGLGFSAFWKFFARSDDQNSSNQNDLFAVVIAFALGTVVSVIIAVRRRRRRMLQ